MEYNVRSGTIDTISTNALVIGVFARKQLTGAAEQVDKATKGAIQSALKNGDFTGKSSETLTLYNLSGIKAPRVILLGLGNKKTHSHQTVAKTLAKIVMQLNAGAARDMVFALPDEIEESDHQYEIIRNFILQAEQAIYRFDQCKSEAEPPTKPLRKMSLLVANRKYAGKIKKVVAHGQAIAKGVALAKDLSNLPGNICTPTYLGDQAKKLARQSTKLKTTVLTEAAMKRLGMDSLLSVSRGSREPAKLIVMEYKGAKATSKPVVLVGKGLTFDAGGISLKPGAGMDEMKYDMCGSASVFGTMQACIDLELPINLVGIVPSSENMPDGDANKPGDIVTSMAGLTIEILNTDAEGRLILCDALTYAEKFKPAAVIDIATLTGACVVALGHHTTGLLANDDKLADELLDAGVASGDEAWRLPMGEKYMRQLDSNFADMANIGGPTAGTITAACFLSRFTEKYKWAHLDIAGTAWKKGAQKGATGRPVTLLTHLLLKRSKQI